MTTPEKYRKKPVVIEAIQWDGTAEGATPIIDWILAGGGTARYHSPNGIDYTSTHELVIDTLEGKMWARRGDWIIRGVQGEHYPCKPDIFDATYEAVKPPARRYRVVRDAADNPQPGELVQSRYSSKGAIWRITGVEERRYGSSRPHLRIQMVSLSSGRQDDRHSGNLVIVEAVNA